METKKYELMFILRPDRTEEETNLSIKKVEDLLATLKVEDLVKDVWGHRDLAYPILKYTQGFYILMNFTMNSAHVNKIEEALNIREDVIRYMVIRDEKDRYLEKFRKKEEIKAKKRSTRPKEEDFDKQQDETPHIRKDFRKEPYYKPRKEIHDPNLNREGEVTSTMLKKRSSYRTEEVEEEKGE